MARVEDLFRFHEIETVFRFLGPWNLENGVEMAFDDCVVR